MKEINISRQDRILEAIYRGKHEISNSSLEKDYHVTDALRVISEKRNDHFELVFGGGTSLSKAYGIIERFSEDAEIKFSSKSNQYRSQISKLIWMPLQSNQVQDKLATFGFIFSAKEHINKRSAETIFLRNQALEEI